MSARGSAGIGADVSSRVSLISWRLCLLVALLAGCELRGLTHAQLHGQEPDAAVAPADAEAPAPDVGTLPVDATSPPPVDAMASPPDAAVARDLSGPEADPPPVLIVTGAIRTNCGGVDAKVGAGGKHTCAFEGKGSYILRLTGLRPGNRITLTAEKPGFKPAPYTAVIELKANGTTQDVDLTYDGPCEEVRSLPKCVCDRAAGCEPS
jgi:hypothetical protein